MKFRIRRFPQVLLASAVLAVSFCVAGPAQAAIEGNIACSGGGTFNVQDNVVQSSTPTCAGAVVIPANVTRLSGGSFQRSQVTSVTFAQGSKLKNINGGVFYNTPLTSIVLPNGLEIIEYEAFSKTNLKHISIPGTVKGMYGLDFLDTSLETVVFESRTASSLFLGDRMFEETPNLRSITFKGPNQLRLNDFPAAISADYDWLGWSTTEGGPIVSFPLANTNPGDLVLYPKRTPRAGVSKLPCSLGGTFSVRSGSVSHVTRDCAGAISIPGTVSNISEDTFSVIDVETVVFESRVAGSLSARNAFRNSSKLRSVTFMGAVVIGDLGESGKGESTKSDFDWTGWSLSEGGPIVTFPLTVSASSSVTTLHPKWTRKNFTDVACSLSGTIRIVGNTLSSRTSDCAGVVSIPANVTEIRSGFFSGNRAITSVVFATNSQLTTIGDGAFSWTGITSIALPAGLTQIGDGIFEGVRLASVSIKGPFVFAERIFGWMDNAAPGDIPEDYTLSGWSLSNGGPLVTFPLTVAASDTVTLYPKWTAKNVTYVACSLGGTFRIVNDVIAGSSANCAGQITIPATITAIDDSSFQNRNITSVVFDANSQLTRIGSSAFAKTKITSINLPSGVTQVGGDAFFNNRLLRSVTLNGPSTLNNEPFEGRRYGNTWAGWSTSEGGSIVTYPLTIAASSSVTLYPNNTPNTFVVTYDSTGGTTVAPGSAAGDQIELPTPPTLESFTFGGWYYDAWDWSSGPVTYWERDNNATLYARWNYPYRAIFDSKGGSNVSAITFAGDVISTAPATPSRTGFTFKGWSATESGTVLTFPYSPGVMQDITLYAQWEMLAPVVTAGPTPNSKVISFPTGVTNAVIPATSNLPSIKLDLAGAGGTAVATVVPTVSPTAPAATPFDASTTKIVDINITGITGSVTICIDGAATDALFHFTGGKWEELPQRSYANGQVCGVTSSFSPFAAAPRKKAAAPTNLSVIRGDKSLSISFTPGATFGAEITRYEFSVDNGKTWSRVSGGDVKSPVTIGGLTNGTTYSVQLRAVNAAGSGADSAAVTGKPREALLADSSGIDVPIVKDPAVTFALNSDIAVRGNKVAVALVAPTSAKSKVSYYMFTMKPKTKGAAIVKQTYKAKAKGTTTAILTGKPKVTYTVSVTAIYANGSRKSWTGPSLTTQ